MKSIALMTAIILLPAITCQSQISNAKTETVKVYGNCGMCENVIEKSANKKKMSEADWNKETKMATITYDSKKTNVDAILKDIALAGYDNQSFLAPDAAYNKLPGCCKYDREKKTMAKMDHSKMDMKKNDHAIHSQEAIGHNADSNSKAANSHAAHGMAMETQEQPIANHLQPVFDSYFLLKDALVKTDGINASAYARGLQTSINAVKMDRLPADVHTVWMKVLGNLKEDAKNINGTKDVASQRNHFMSLSKSMYALIKAAKPAKTVYYQFCPMANDGKGANWLSKESGIKNPYYGSQMLTCGKTVETIKQ